MAQNTKEARKKNTKHARKFSVIFVLSLFSVVLVSAAQAVEADTSSSTLAVENNIVLTPEEKLAKSKDDLTKALDLSLKKVDSLKGRLNELNFPELSQEEKLKNEALTDLEAYADYYNEAKKDLEEKASLEEIKDLAKEVKYYRDTTYTPGVEKIVRFILVFYNEQVLGVANERLGKIEADVKKLDKLGVIKEGDFRGKLDEAGRLIETAHKLQGEAKKIILNATSTKSDLASTDLREDGLSEDSVEMSKPAAKEPSAKDMIENSLNNVKTVYDIFLELNQSVKKALGL